MSITVWLTGLPSAGKSTLARALSESLARRDLDHQILDGDEMREYLTAGLGFSRQDRDTNVRRIGYVASLLSRHGILTICPVISPYQDARDEIRALHDPGRFFEVYVSTPIAECERRDVKGLYARARLGELSNMTGIDDPYEPPRNPDLVVDTVTLGIDLATNAILGPVLTRLDELSRARPTAGN